MRSPIVSILFAISCGLVVPAAWAQPVANLLLTCPDAGAIGQQSCSGLTYESPNNPNSMQLIVLRSNGTWARAVSLAPTDVMAVCALPVEPGTYSSCRDESGTRRIVFRAKSEIFNFGGPPSPISGAHIIDLSTSPVEIREPGVYVFDRNWFAGGPFDRAAIVIQADNVTLDLQGFELSVVYAGISSTGQDVIIRNGRIIAAQRDEAGAAISTTGSRNLIESVRASGGKGAVIGLGGIGSVLTNSTVIAEGGSLAILVRANDDTIVRGNQIIGGYISTLVYSRATIVDNVITCGVNCIDVAGNNNTIGRNRLINGEMLIRADHNHVFGNVFGCRNTPIVVEGLGNTIRDNLVPRCSPMVETGILFGRDGNFYGDNIVWATVPFAVGATVQTDLGGNVGFSQ